MLQQSRKIVLILYIISTLFTVSLHAERQIGKLNQNTFLFCNAEANQVISRKLAEGGEVLDEEIIRRSTAKNFLRKVNKKLNQLLSRYRNSTDEEKQDKLYSQMERIFVIKKNSKKCLFGEENKDQNFDPTEIDPNQSVNQDAGISNALSQGEIKASCDVIAGSAALAIANQSDLADPILAPLSGSLNCTLEDSTTQDLVLKVFANNSDTDPELLITRVIRPEIVNPDNSFIIPICLERADCFQAKKLNVAIQTTGIKVELNQR